MARRLGWDQLKPATRARYAKHGGRELYDSGGSLAEARGHGRTPERPGDADRNPTLFESYLRKRGRPVNVITNGGVVTVSGLTPIEASQLATRQNFITGYIHGRQSLGTIFNKNNKSFRDPFASPRDYLRKYDGKVIRNVLINGVPGDLKLDIDPDRIDSMAFNGTLKDLKFYADTKAA